MISPLTSHGRSEPVDAIDQYKFPLMTVSPINNYMS